MCDHTQDLSGWMLSSWLLTKFSTCGIIHKTVLGGCLLQWHADFHLSVWCHTQNRSYPWMAACLFPYLLAHDCPCYRTRRVDLDGCTEVKCHFVSFSLCSHLQYDQLKTQLPKELSQQQESFVKQVSGRDWRVLAIKHPVTKVDIVAVGELYRAIFWPTPAFDSWGFWLERSWISASVVPHYGGVPGDARMEVCVCVYRQS